MDPRTELARLIAEKAKALIDRALAEKFVATKIESGGYNSYMTTENLHLELGEGVSLGITICTVRTERS
jgi:hypothetical protein